MTVTLDIPAGSLDQLAWIAQNAYNTTNLAYAVAQMAGERIAREGARAKDGCGGCFDPKVFVAPIAPPPAKAPANGQEGWEALVESIAEMLESDEFSWAEETLAGIQGTIKERRMVTDPQRRAVTNIARSKGWTI